MDNKLPYALPVSCGYDCCNQEMQPLSGLMDKAGHKLYQMKAKKRAGN